MNYDKQADYEEWSFDREEDRRPIVNIHEAEEDLEIASNISTDPINTKITKEPLSNIKSQIESKIKPVKSEQEKESLI